MYFILFYFILFQLDYFIFPDLDILGFHNNHFHIWKGISELAGKPGSPSGNSTAPTVTAEA
jgi:hypothetical protein